MAGAAEYLLIKQASELLGVSANTVRAWASSGKLQEYRHPVNNYRMFRRDEVETLRDQIENPPPAHRLRKTKPK